MPVTIGVLALLALVAFGVLQGYLHGHAAFGVSAAGVSLSRATPAQARGDLGRLVARRELDTIVLQSGQGPLTLRLADLGLTIDLAATAQRAVRDGRLGLLGLGLWYGRGGAVEPVVRFDPTAFQTDLQKIAPAFDKAPRDATLALVGDTVGVRPAATGLAIDEAGSQGDSLAALCALAALSGAGAPHGGSQPAVGTAAAQTAATQAARVREHAAAAALSRARDRPEPGADRGHALGELPAPTPPTQPLTFDNRGAAGRPAPSVLVRRDARRERDGRREGQEGAHQAQQGRASGSTCRACFPTWTTRPASRACARSSCP